MFLQVDKRLSRMPDKMHDQVAKVIYRECKQCVSVASCHVVIIISSGSQVLLRGELAW